MHWLFWVSLSIFFGVGYRVGYKAVSDDFAPLFAVGVISLVSSLVSLGLHYCIDRPKVVKHVLKPKTLLLLLVVGIFTAGLEVSNMMMYKAGGLVSIAQVLSSNMVSIIIFTIGIFAFRERLNAGQSIGFFIGLIGVTLMTYHSA